MSLGSPPSSRASGSSSSDYNNDSDDSDSNDDQAVAAASSSSDDDQAVDAQVVDPSNFGFQEEKKQNEEGEEGEEGGVWRVKKRSKTGMAAAGVYFAKKWRRCSMCKQPVPEGVLHDCFSVKEQNSDFLKMFACARCGDIFTPISSIAMHQCSFHPGRYVDNAWTCCGRRKTDVVNRYTHNMLWSRRNCPAPATRDPPGCTRCDHWHNRLPANTHAHGKEVNVQTDLPFTVLSNLQPEATERPGWRTKLELGDGVPPTKIGVLVGTDMSPLEKKTLLASKYRFKLKSQTDDDFEDDDFEDEYDNDSDDEENDEKFYELLHSDVFRTAVTEHFEGTLKADREVPILRREWTKEDIDTSIPIHVLVEQYDLRANEVMIIPSLA